MTREQSLVEWRVIGETVPGASHLRAGVPNQDAILQVRESGRGLPLLVSISDGHGSNKCFRSDRGSRFAVKRGTQLLGEFLDELRSPFDLAELENRANEILPGEFVKRWRETAEAHLKAQPFTDEELETLEKKEGPRARKLVEENPLLAYGATSLSVAVTNSFVLYLQLGDGEILNVSESGQVSTALVEDKRLFANETTSLCTPDAEKNFRIRLQQITEEPPALILLSTDGYVNSFSDSAGFLKVGSDLLEMLRADGFDFVNASLKGWLEEATHAGSGDDCTVALLCRMQALKATDVSEVTATATKATTEAAAGKSVSSAPVAEAVSEARHAQTAGAPAQNPERALIDSAEPTEANKTDGQKA